MIKRKTKVIAVIASVLLLIGGIILLTFCTAEDAAKRAADDMREEMKTAFKNDLSQYEDMLIALSEGFDYPEYCIILTDGEPTVDVNYENVSVGDEQMSDKLKEFAENTGTEVIYVDAEAVYFKKEFQSGLGKVSEANFFIRHDETEPDLESAQKITGAWYYAEFEIE